MTQKKVIKDLLHFLDKCPTAWHAVEGIADRLMNENFEELTDDQQWQLKPGHRYFVARGGTVCAFMTPKSKIASVRVAASHTDSPGFKLKPNAEFRREHMVMFGLEVYGSPLLSSWLNRDLGIAGNVYFSTDQKPFCESLITIDDRALVIPQLAIHLDREVNESLKLNKQEHLAALACLDYAGKGQQSYLEELLRQKIDFNILLGADLFLYPLEKASAIGSQNELISSYRIDSLASVHAVLTGFLEHQRIHENVLQMVVFWNHEEIGSATPLGAHSPFFAQLLERVMLSMNHSREDFLKIIPQSFCVSVDLAHALHPNYIEKHEPRHQVLLGNGIVIKFSAQQRYATDAYSAARVVSICERSGIPYQKYVNRGDIPAGSTIGPLHATGTGMPTVDIGCAQLSMHSAREIASAHDHLSMCKFIEEYFKIN